MRSIYWDSTERADDVAQRVPEHRVFDEKGRLHARCPKKRNGEEEIDIGAVGHQCHDRLAAVRELTFNAPTRNAKNSSPYLSSQEVSSLWQFVAEHLPIHSAFFTLKAPDSTVTVAKRCTDVSRQIGVTRRLVCVSQRALGKGLISMKLNRHKMIRLNVKTDNIIAGKDPTNPK